MSFVDAAFAEPTGFRARIAGSARDSPGPRAALVAAPPPSPIDAIYDAALAPERWPDALAALAAALGGNAATLHAGSAGGPPAIIAAFGVGEAALSSYASRWDALDPMAAATAGSAWAAPATAREAAGAGLERTAFFTGWMLPNNFDDALCLDLLPPGTAHGASIRVFRPPLAPRFGPAESAVLARLAPHLRRAAELRRRLSASAQAVPAEPFAEALDRLAAGVALLDARATVVWANRTAGLLLRSGDGLSIDRNGVLRATAPGAGDALRRLVGAAAAGAEGAMPVPRPSGNAALALHAVPLPASAPRASVLLLLGDPGERGASDAALQRRLRAIYGLTAAEATVAARAAHGVGMPEVAQSLGLGIATARTHAQRVFSKTGARGQAELARQVERLSLLRAADRPA